MTDRLEIEQGLIDCMNADGEAESNEARFKKVYEILWDMWADYNHAERMYRLALAKGQEAAKPRELSRFFFVCFSHVRGTRDPIRRLNKIRLVFADIKNELQSRNVEFILTEGARRRTRGRDQEISPLIALLDEKDMP